MNIPLSVIIPTRGPLKAFQKTLNGILEPQSSENFELIVINDGGSNEISSYIQSLQKVGVNIKEIYNEVRQGSYTARNQGIQSAGFEWLLFVDDDLTIPNGWYQKMIPYSKDYEFICCNIQMEKLPRETLGEKYSRIKGFEAKSKFELQQFGLTTFLFVQKKVFTKIGYFDERLYAGGDYIFSRAVYEAGFKQVFLWDLVVYHQPKTWRAQFRTLCRINKGKIDRANLYPELCGGERLTAFDLLRTLKYLLESLVYYKRTAFFQSGEVNWWEHQIGQISYQTIYLATQILVLLFPGKRFNW